MATSSDMVFGSFIGDALALGPHWIYHQKELKQRFGHILTYLPPATAYHTGKQAGDFTHYGDQTLLLLRSLTETGHFDLHHFANVWREFWEDPETTSYHDGATKATLSHLKAGAAPESSASSSSDLGGASRIAPLFLLEWENDGLLFASARAQTAFTHGDPAVIDAAEFFARVALSVLKGSTIPEALEKTAALPHWKALPADWILAAEKSSSSDSTDGEALEDHGLTCHVPDAFTGVCHLLLRHPEAPATGLIENVNAGGDSAARGMILGLVYGARFPVSLWQKEWLDDLRARREIDRLIEKLK